MGWESKELLFRDLFAVDIKIKLGRSRFFKDHSTTGYRYKNKVALGPKCNILMPYRGH
jgi:hypothetical protein